MSSDEPVFNAACYPHLRTIFTNRHPLLQPSSPSSSTSFDLDCEWVENINQLHLLVDVVLLPVLGKWLGRKSAYWIYTRYQWFGLGIFAYFFWQKNSLIDFKLTEAARLLGLILEQWRLDEPDGLHVCES